MLKHRLRFLPRLGTKSLSPNEGLIFHSLLKLSPADSNPLFISPLYETKHHPLMTFKEIQDLIKLINKTDLAEFKMKDGEFELSIRTDKFSKTKAAPVSAVPSFIPMPSAPAAMPMATAPATPAPSAAAKPAEAASDAADTSNYLEVKSPIVGTFYRSSSPEKPAFIEVGDNISEGSVVCIVEAMKLFNEIESEVSGKVVKVMIEDAQPVEYDQVLFLVDPKG
ncbi:MAG: acetyl-CoA carboxylase biotin carboxyl carrier protein [Saprospiraceae bacterium]